jgi:Gpi18-like mannosyltransferase
MRRNGIAAVLFAVALSTKPQAIPLVIPFVAWCWASGGWREFVRCGAIGALTLLVLWLPFIPAGGPLAYLGNLRVYQDEIFPYLSLRAWNPWSLLQEAAAGGQFIPDDVPIVGPITFRVIGFVLTGLVSIVVMAAVLRRPEPRTLILATTTSALVFFCLMTQMHERYSYAALVIPVLLLVDARMRWWWLAVSVAVTLNLLAAIPPTPAIGELLSATGPLAIVGALTITGLTFWLLSYLRRDAEPEPTPTWLTGT